MSVPDYGDPRPAKVQIAEDLREQISAGTYAPGSKLPPVRELAGRYHVVTGTVRDAIAILRGEGLVQTHSTRGTYVLERSEAKPSPEYLRLEAAIRRLDERVAFVEKLVLGTGEKE